MKANYRNGEKEFASKMGLEVSLIIRNEILIGPCVLCMFSSDIPKENIWPQSKALSLEDDLLNAQRDI